METPDHHQPTTTPPTTSTFEQTEIPTISCLDHILHYKDIKEILDTELGTQNRTVINMIQQDSYPESTHFEPNFYLRNTYGQTLYHLSDITPVHTSNNCNDFVTLFKHEGTLHQHDQLPLKCKGIGTILIKTPISSHPLIITPVYYCPSATTGELSFKTLKQYNPYYTIKIQPEKSVDFHINNQTTTYSVPIINQDMTSYIFLPVYNICTDNVIHPSQITPEFLDNRDEYLESD